MGCCSSSSFRRSQEYRSEKDHPTWSPNNKASNVNSPNRDQSLKYQQPLEPLDSVGPTSPDSPNEKKTRNSYVFKSRVANMNGEEINDDDRDDDSFDKEKNDTISPLSKQFEKNNNKPSNANGSSSSSSSFQAETSGVSWSNLYIDPAKAEEAVIGHGSFGTVVKAKLRQIVNEVVYDETTNMPVINKTVKDVDVAVKVLTRQQITKVSETEFKKICDKAFQEVQILQEAESKMLYRDCIIRTYGIARGILPDEICSMFGMQNGTEGVGIIMRYEGGGSLETYLSRQRTLAEKLRILEGIARGLTELHGLGIIHSDIKPENILLSSDKPPEVRLADFGLSVFRDNKKLSKSSLVATTHSRGTPIYFAPEMLMNPYQVVQRKVIAQSSRKTDIYAFALLSWEVLTQNQAFFDVDTEGELCAKVHRGQRPPIEQIPRNCPIGVVNTVKACWDTNRNRRKNAIECLCIYQFYYGIVAKKRFDIFYSHSPNRSPLSTFVMHHLIRLGYRIWYDQDETDVMTATRQNALIDGICRSTVVINFCNRSYQENMKCMFELKEARTMTPPKPIITLASEADPLTYSTKLFLDLTQIKTMSYADISGITTDYFYTEDVPSEEKLVALQQMLHPVMTLLTQYQCYPSLDVLGKIAD